MYTTYFLKNSYKSEKGYFHSGSSTHTHTHRNLENLLCGYSCCLNLLMECIRKLRRRRPYEESLAEPFLIYRRRHHDGSECIRDCSNTYHRNGLGYLVLGQCRDQQNRNGKAIWHQLTHRPNGLVLTNRILLYLYNDDDMSFYLVQISKVRSRTCPI